MIVDDNLLLAYVSDDLPPEQRDAIDAMLAHDAALRGKVGAMQASDLPYQAAFAAQPLPGLPPRLHDEILDMIRIGAAPALAPVKHSWRDRLQLLGGLAAAVVVGIGLHAAVGAYLNTGEKPGWIADVANYQRLYVRDTVQAVRADPVVSRAVINSLYQQNHIRIDIPDLSKLGLQFKRVQRLGYGALPLMQMVYLPEQGNPVALCVIPENGPDVAPHQARVKGMETISWRRAGLAYLLVADAPAAPLAAAGNLLYEGKLPSWPAT
jgi:anti-sigma factor RsiW